MKKFIIFIFIFMVLISGVVAPKPVLGTFQKGECVDLLQVCDDCTYVNITRVLYPNNSVALSNATMTQYDTEFIYNFCNTSILGIYKVSGHGDISGTKTPWSYSFEITGTGFEFNQPRSMMYVALLIILIFLFVTTLIAIPMLPSDDNRDEEGSLISINQMKYIRPI